MTDPKRWLDDDGDATSLERRLLSRGKDARAPRSIKGAVWASVTAGATAASAATTVSAFTVAKAVLLGALAGAVFTGTMQVVFPHTAAQDAARRAPSGMPSPSREVRASEPPGEAVSPPTVGEAVPVKAREDALEIPKVAPPRSNPTSMVPRRDERADVDKAPRSAAAAPRAEGLLRNGSPDPGGEGAAPPSPSSDGVNTMHSLLREESRLLAEARRALRGGEAARALGILQGAEERFPKGALTEERAALVVEAWAKVNPAEAAARARAFLRAYPQSPYAPSVESIAGERSSGF